jgi:hypothetical protein
MVDKKDKELSDKDLKKATGGAADGRRPVLKGGHTNRPGAPEADDSQPSPTTSSPKSRPGTKINPM